MSGRPPRRNAAQLLPAGHAFHRGILLSVDVLARLDRLAAALPAAADATGAGADRACTEMPLIHGRDATQLLLSVWHDGRQVPEPSGPLRMRKVSCTSAVLSGAIALAAPAQASMLGSVPHGPEMPVIRVLGCRIHGLGIVCSPGVVLPKRLRKERYHQEEVEPSYKGQSGTTPSAKGGSASTKGSSPATNGSQKDTVEQPGSTGAHACPPGNVVLEKPDAKGSYCEPVAGQSAQPGQSGDAASQMDKPSVSGTAGSTNSHSQTGAAAGSAASSAGGGGGAPSGVNPEVVAPAAAATGSSGVCCSAQVVDKASATSTPAGSSIRSCRQNETDARNAVAATAATSNFSLAGPISCDTK